MAKQGNIGSVKVRRNEDGGLYELGADIGGQFVVFHSQGIEEADARVAQLAANDDAGDGDALPQPDA